jgi:hypothetical protein
MNELTTTATLVEPAALGDDAITAVLSRSELESAFAADTPARLWLELAQEGADEPTRLTIDLDATDLEAILGLTSDDEIALAFDDNALASMFGDAEVEAHGMRGALAIAVVAAAVAAPAGLAATPQTASPATEAQRVTTAATAQRASLAVNPQVASLATKAQVKAQVSKAAAKKAQISAAKASGLRLLKIGITR